MSTPEKTTTPPPADFKKLVEQVDWLAFQVKILRALFIGCLFFLIRLAFQPVRAASVDVSSPGNYVGIFTDNQTGIEFELYDYSQQTDLEPIDLYYLNANSGVNSSSLQARSWLDCQGLSTVQRACCNTAHGFGNVFKDLSTATLGAFINDEINNAFSGGRGNQSPRSICHTYDGNNLCTSWATYDSNNLNNGESGDIAGFAASCAKSGYSSEFKGTDSNGGIIFICVSNRATGCDSSIG